MKTIPIWQELKTKDYPILKDNIETDILIIGGGITGVNLLHALKDDKRKVVLVEKNKLGMGITSRSTAKITFLQQDIYSRLKKNFGKRISKLYYDAIKESISKMVNNINKEKIACDLEKVDSYFYALTNKEITKVENEKRILESFGEKVYDVDMLPSNFKVKKGIFVKNTYVFHPLKYVVNLAKKSLTKNHEIYENTNIYNIEKKKDYYVASTDGYKIKCQKIVLACHYPYFLMPYLFPIKGYLEKSYIMARTSNNKYFSAINKDNPIYSFRYYKNYLVTLSSSHNLCYKNNQEANFKDLFKLCYENDISYAWSNTDIITLDNLPYIGLIKDNMYIATGYNTWGMTSSYLAAIILKDLLNNKHNKYEDLCSPNRHISKDKIMGFGLSLWSNSYSYINSKINLQKSYYNKNPHFITIEGQKIGVYVDENNNSYMVKIKCPHLGCSLLFNKVEKHWECPCHGSVFNIDGKCIIGPSNYDISVKNHNKKRK